MSAESRKQRKEQVLEAARRVLKEYGVRKLTLEDVAEQTGLAISSLYYYFDNKSDLIRAVAEIELAEITAAIDANVAAAERFEDKIHAVGQTVLAQIRELSRIPGLSSDDRIKIDSEVPQLAAQFREHVRGTIQATIEQGVAAGVFEIDDPELAAVMIMAGIRGLADEILDGEISVDQLEGMEHMSSLLMNGLKKR